LHGENPPTPRTPSSRSGDPLVGVRGTAFLKGTPGPMNADIYATTVAEARDVVDRALRACPLVAACGLLDPPHKDYPRERHTISALVAIAADDAHELGQVRRAADWIKLQDERATWNRRHSSYGLKHIVEGWWRARTGGDVYVSNGVFIATAIGLGRAFIRLHCSVNAGFKFSERTIRATTGRK
jgi:hypothetical protein